MAETATDRVRKPKFCIGKVVTPSIISIACFDKPVLSVPNAITTSSLTASIS